MKKDKELFKTYYERKKKRKYSLFSSALEGFIIAAVMVVMMIIPVTVIFLNADKLGFWYLVLFLIYAAVMSVLIYIVLRYREIIGIQGYFTKEEFDKEFKKELWWFNILDSIRGIIRL